MRCLLASMICLVGLTAQAAEVITYAAPSDEQQQPTPYEVWAGDQRIDVYTARTFDAPFARQAMGLRRSLFLCQFRHGRAGGHSRRVAAFAAQCGDSTRNPRASPTR